MASATIVHPEPVPTPEAEITLVLSESEAKALRAIFAHVGGHPDTGRGHINRISSALGSVGIWQEDGLVTGSIYFRELDGSVCKVAPHDHFTS